MFHRSSYPPEDFPIFEEKTPPLIPDISCPCEFDPTVSRLTRKEKKDILRRFDQTKGNRLKMIIVRILVGFASFLITILFTILLFDMMGISNNHRTFELRAIIFLGVWIWLTAAVCWMLNQIMTWRFRELTDKRRVIFIKKVRDPEEGFSDYFHLYVWEYVSDHPEQVVYLSNTSNLLSKKLKEGDLLFRYSGQMENGNTMNLFDSKAQAFD